MIKQTKTKTYIWRAARDSPVLTIASSGLGTGNRTVEELIVTSWWSSFRSFDLQPVSHKDGSGRHGRQKLHTFWSGLSLPGNPRPRCPCPACVWALWLRRARGLTWGDRSQRENRAERS